MKFHVLSFCEGNFGNIPENNLVEVLQVLPHSTLVPDLSGTLVARFTRPVLFILDLTSQCQYCAPFSSDLFCSLQICET